MSTISAWAYSGDSSNTQPVRDKKAASAAFFIWQNPGVSVQTDRLISAKPSSPQEEQFERSLRPGTLAEYVGQEKVRGQLEIFIEAARRRGVALDHVLLVGAPGL